MRTAKDLTKIREALRAKAAGLIYGYDVPMLAGLPYGAGMWWTRTTTDGLGTIQVWPGPLTAEQSDRARTFMRELCGEPS